MRHLEFVVTIVPAGGLVLTLVLLHSTATRKGFRSDVYINTIRVCGICYHCVRGPGFKWTGVKQHFTDICNEVPTARSKLFTTSLCFNSKENTILGFIYVVWRRHENMSPCSGSRIIVNSWWANCFMSRRPAANLGPVNLRDTFSPPTVMSSMLTIRPSKKRIGTRRTTEPTAHNNEPVGEGKFSTGLLTRKGGLWACMRWTSYQSTFVSTI